MALAAPVSLLASDMARAPAWVAGLLALAAGACIAVREAARPPASIVLRGGGQGWVDGIEVEALLVEWRGPLAFVRWRGADGSMQRRSFWPDTLRARQRRELRLAMPGPGSASGSGGMAH